MTGTEGVDPATVAASDAFPPWCEPLWEVLATRAAKGTLPHALLLGGPAGLGKRALAEAFARARLCAAPRGDRACGTCRACRLLAAGTHPDRLRVTLEVNPRTGTVRREIVVEQIRALSARLAMASQLDGWQVAVIEPAEAMNPAAQNALLKTLEEPTGSSLIVLVADRPWRLAATVRSRCQRVDFSVPSRADARAWLAGLGVEHIDALLPAAGGNPGRARQLAKQGGMQRRQQVAHDLLALTTGRGDARTIGRGWADDGPAERLEHAARLLEQSLRVRASGGHARFDPGWSDADLAGAVDSADRLRTLLDGPLRSDLALFDWLDRLPRHVP